MSELELFFNVKELPEFDNHQFVGFIGDEMSGLCGFIAIHRGGLKNPSFGATRIWKYLTEEEALQDALKLSKTMSYKSAMAGLKYGGAKGVIIANFPDTQSKRKVLKTYAQKINYLSGHFITGADVGITEKEVNLMRRVSPYVVGIKVDPVKFTVIGLFNSLRVCLKEVFGNEDIQNRSFSIQGLGKVGLGLLEKIAKDAARIIVCDIDPEKAKVAKRKFPKIMVVDPSEIDKQKVDVFSPCALSNCINHKNISLLDCKIIVGGANCQLENNQIGEILYKLGILYAPDYIVNAGGLISVVDEFENNDYREKRIILKVENIKNTLSGIFELSKRKRQATNLVADEMAKKILDKFE